MAIIAEIGTELSLVLKVGENPKALYVHYSKIDSGLINGQVYSPERLLDLVVPQSEGEALINRVLKWIDEIKRNQPPTNLVIIADMPFEVNSSLLVGPDGVYYLFEMGDLSIHIEWDKGTDEVTIFAGNSFTVSFEGFIYYVDTLVDLTNEIKKQQAL